MAVRESAAPNRRVVFGTSQERKLFPFDYAPNRLGNEQPSQGSPRLGPGCYENHLVRTLVYDVQKRPESKKGYTLAARTASRFLPVAQTVTPSPQKYQKDNTWSNVSPASKTPFNSTTLRFSENSVLTDNKPGPGTYAHDTKRNRQVTWPLIFGSPDWARLPQLERKALRTELPCDKEFRKQRKRVAYMSLFYS